MAMLNNQRVYKHHKTIDISSHSLPVILTYPAPHLLFISWLFLRNRLLWGIILQQILLGKLDDLTPMARNFEWLVMKNMD